MQTIGRYRLFDAIGHSSMWTVHVAHDPFLDRRVAVKVAAPPPETAASEADIFEMLSCNKTHTAGMRRHPNIAQSL